MVSHLGSTIQQCIEKLVKQQDGRLRFDILRDHCLGTGNISSTVSMTQSIKKTLTYSDERRGNFNQFLQKISKMFLIYKEEGEETTEEAHIKVLM